MLKSDEMKLKVAIQYLRRGLNWMREAFSFEQLASGYGAETYEETLEYLIKGIEEYIERNENYD